MDDSTIAALRTACAAVFDIGLATMLGALATPGLMHDATSAWAARRVRRCRRLFLHAGVVALLGQFAWLAVQSVAMADTPGDSVLATAWGLVTDTRFGQAWVIATAAVAGGTALSALRVLRPASPLALGLAIVIAAAAHAATGHAGANGIDWQLPTMAVHLLAIGLWAGGVIVGALAVLRGEVDAVDGARYAARLSRLATVALVGVAVTGAASAWHGLGGTLAPLAVVDASSWATVLDAKLVLVAAAIVLGAINRFAVLPRLPHAWLRFARVLRVEAVVMVLILVAAAMLANGEPPAM